MEDLLQCPICYVNYNDKDRTPRQLNTCQHILCSVCLPHLIKQPSRQNGPREFIECPICKEKLFCQLSQVPKSLVIMQVMEATNRSSSNSNYSKPQSSTHRQSNNDSFSPMPSMKSKDGQFFSPPVIPPRPSVQETPTFKPGQQTNPFYSDYDPNQTYTTTSTVQEHIEPWNTQTFLRKIFNDMDVNGDGSITSVELQEALRRGQSSNEFNLKTIQLLISRYDKNGDQEISFDEFFDLYCNLNEEYENFLMMDLAGSGFIDLEEFSGAMSSKGYNFSPKFFRFIVGEISKHSSSPGIKFDNYIRVMARFDYLCEYYRKTPYFHNKHNLESYLKNTFFQDFW